MIERKEMREGLLVWWSADRHFREWSCPAVITIVAENHFKVLSFDDFKETDWLRIDDIPNGDKSVRTTEMEICTLREVQDYFKERMRDLEDRVTKKVRELEDAKNKLTELQRNIKKRFS